MIFRWFLALVLCGAGLAVPPVTAQVEIDFDQSGVERGWFGRNDIRLSLSAPVPFRVFTLDAPPRLVIDLSGVAPDGFVRDGFLPRKSALSDVRLGVFAPGWSRLIADLNKPVEISDVAMRTDPETGRAVLSLSLMPTDPASFAARSGPPPGARWVPQRKTLPPSGPTDDFVVVIDPGHGGVDPGAERGGISEKTLMLMLAQRVADQLRATGDTTVFMTREADVFVSLDARVALAQAVHADLFLSLHADALPDGGARGATVYTLSDAASDAATAQLAARHNRADILAGADLTASEDGVAKVLLDLARQETEPRSHAMAQTLLRVFEEMTIPVNNRPLRQAGFSVLKSADIPSVLVEVAFLSSPRDLANVQDPRWQDRAVASIVEAIARWRRDDASKSNALNQ